jgi:hypothetical protein
MGFCPWRTPPPLVCQELIYDGSNPFARSNEIKHEWFTTCLADLFACVFAAPSASRARSLTWPASASFAAILLNDRPRWLSPLCHRNGLWRRLGERLPTAGAGEANCLGDREQRGPRWSPPNWGRAMICRSSRFAGGDGGTRSLAPRVHAGGPAWPSNRPALTSHRRRPRRRTRKTQCQRRPSPAPIAGSMCACCPM